MSKNGYAIILEDEFELVTPEMTSAGRQICDEYGIDVNDNEIDEFLEAVFLAMFDEMNMEDDDEDLDETEIRFNS